MSSNPKGSRAAFVESYFRFATPEDVPDTKKAREELALAHLNWGMDRRNAEIKVRAFNPRDLGYGSSHTVIETITDDSPFIVDSLTMQLNALSQGIHVKLHTVLSINRDREGRLVDWHSEGAPESWTHFEIPRVLDSGELKRVETRLRSTLSDVRSAVHDWPQMLEILHRAADDLRRFRKGPEVEESGSFLDWLADNHFTLLGYTRLSKAETGPALGLMRSANRRQALRKETVQEKPGAEVLIVTKAPIRSTVHRPALLDDIRIDSYDSNGKLHGEHRFIGLFTSTAYSESPQEIPLVRSKVHSVLQRSGLDPSSHRGKALSHILATFPRDELFQNDISDLERIGLGILNIEERRKIRLFLSQSAYGDFLSCLVFLPRDGYSTLNRTRIEQFLSEKLDGNMVDSQLTISESSLARLAVTIQRSNERTRIPDVDALEKGLAEVAIAWVDRARLALLSVFAEERALELHHRFAGAFPLSYQEAVQGPRIARDISAICEIDDGRESSFLDLAPHGTGAVFTVIRSDRPVPLYRANPILENMGIRLLQETGYKISVKGRSFRIQDFEIESTHGESLESPELASKFMQCFAQALCGAVENDGFNQLVITAGLDWRSITILRGYCKYLLQCRAQFSQAYMIDTLRRYPEVVTDFIELFNCYFDPAIDPASRDSLITRRVDGIQTSLNAATSLDDDRILRMFFSALQATLRTNFFQLADSARKNYLSFKLAPARIPEAPEPRPKFEIFVYSPEVEGVHLRRGAIARGGIRWSDRREDFRTEVLGLMKAQQVKNTVIVPAGAKGGFVLKNPPAERTQLNKRGIDCYRIFLRGLLDLTDNIVGKRTVPPDSTVCRDEPDPYLVVAADKGTASFSDTANAVADEYGFWLGDAFASGGSAGYDHKKMGITARGAWESVKRHFRELGTDCQKEVFTVAGIGDMSGDVFGNAMLLSGQIRLVAAFNHRHIFIDPAPDPAMSFAERKRLFELPRSGWDDYQASLISKGGGVFSRQSKLIRISAEARSALGTQATELTPPALIRVILKAPVDLLFNGGIGTYVKASNESPADAADPANDSVRVDGKELRARVIAEGGNLGLTQLGRIEFALGGGMINTDFIDNSAGVDSSDREVNIKILLSDAIRRKELKSNRRNALLASMTSEVAELVLASNYAQTQALSMMATKAQERLGENARLIRRLESRGVLNRSLEFLPDEELIDERRRAGIGFARPELAIILSYAKIELYDSLVRTDIPDERYCQAEVSAYFPRRLSRRFEKSIRAHRLRREIAAMLISSSMINRMGPVFALRAQDDTGADAADVARAYAIVRGIFDTRGLWREIEDLDGQLDAQVQYECFFECTRMIRRAVYWFLHRRDRNKNIESSIDRKKASAELILTNLPGTLCGWSKRSYETDSGNFAALGVPRDLAERIATLRLLTQVLDIAELAAELKTQPQTIAHLYFELGRGLRLDWIREQIEALRVEGHWRAMARGTLRETLGREQRLILRSILSRSEKGKYAAALAAWLAAFNAPIVRLKRTLDEMQSSGQMDFATLSIALKEISRLR